MKSKLTTLNIFRGDVNLLEALIMFLLFMLIHAIHAYCNQNHYVSSSHAWKFYQFAAMLQW